MAQDIRGVEINVGDTVVFGLAQTKTLSKGVVVKINPKTVSIDHHYYDAYTRKNRIGNCLREFDNVVVCATEATHGAD